MANGAPAAPLAGYRVYYGTSANAYTGNSYFAGGATSSGTVTGLGHGTWYFTVFTVDAVGNESNASYQLSKTL
jgi:hypothetical protein